MGNRLFGDDGFGETLFGRQVGQWPARIKRLVMLAQKISSAVTKLCRNGPPIRRATYRTWAMVLSPARDSRGDDLCIDY